MSTLAIVLREPGEPLVEYAAKELQRYVRHLFGFHPPIRRRSADPGADNTVFLGGPASEVLSEQEYVIRPSPNDGRSGLLVVGGSPRATMWAAYELVSAWGVHFLVQGDVYPDEVGPFALPPLDVKRTPVFPRREYRILNELANSGMMWGLSDQERLVDQLAKLRFTGVLANTYAFGPWAHYAFRGIERRTAALTYGWEHPVHSQTIGRELFGNYPVHTNPDFQGAQTYEEMMYRGQRYMRGLIDAAHARGLEVTLAHHLAELPDEFVQKLPELSEGVELPGERTSKPYVHRLGVHSSGERLEAERFRSPLNPVFVDLVETAFVAQIQAYPNAERYCLIESEFPPAGAGVETCWRILDGKYDLERRFPLQEIVEKASKQFFYVEGRALDQALGAIQTLRFLDILVNERDVLRHARNSKAKIQAIFFSEHVQPLVEYVLPPDKCEFRASVDYLPARVAERMYTLEFAKRGKLDVMMTTTIEDDNVGFIPQLVTPSLHKTVQQMREYGIQGFCFRQFDVSQHEPSMAYMVESAWDPSVTPEDSYRRYARRVAGEACEEGLVAVFHEIERLTEASNALIGLGFLVPSLYSRHWAEGTKPDPAWQDFVARLPPIEMRLRSALDKVAPRGKRLVRNYLHFVVFAGQFIQTVDLIRQARMAYDGAQKRWQAQNFVRYHQGMLDVVELLTQAVKQSEVAIRTWASQVVDPTDLGTLAGLNAYGHDWLKGMRHIVYLESQKYGFRVTDDSSEGDGQG